MFVCVHVTVYIYVYVHEKRTFLRKRSTVCVYIYTHIYLKKNPARLSVNKKPSIRKLSREV